MGYERKRGKLADLNALLRGSGRDCSGTSSAMSTKFVAHVKYVITVVID